MQNQYTCNCGKAYTSYATYATHQKLKHSQIHASCTQPQEPQSLPQHSFLFGQTIGEQYYKGVTIIEKGILDLEKIFKGKILSDCDDESSSDLSELSEIES